MSEQTKNFESNQVRLAIGELKRILAGWRQHGYHKLADVPENNEKTYFLGLAKAIGVEIDAQ